MCTLGVATILLRGEGLHCPRCQGSGQCPDCKGEGSQECPACEGSGQRSTTRGHTYSCKSCQGEGTVPCPASCPSCEGSGLITEELQKKVQERRILKFDNLTPHSQFTRVILGLTVLMYGVQISLPEVARAMMLRADLFTTHDYWTLFTPMLLHDGLWHLVLNMGFLWVYGPVLEGILGGRRFLGLYLFSGLVGCLLSWLGNCYIQGSYWAGVGASGALFGFEGAFLALYWRWRMLSWQQIRSLTQWTGVILLGGFALEASGISFLDNFAHLGGLLGGFCLTAALARPSGR